MFGPAPPGTYVPTELKDKLALITGASGGIGQATARLFTSRGLNLALHYNASADTTHGLARVLEAEHGICALAFQADMGSYDAVRAMHAEIVAALGHRDILYNNAVRAGTMLGIKGRIEDISVEEVEVTWRANSGSAFLLTQLCIPHMEAQKWGWIIFCSSVAAAIGGVVGPHYASSKSALHGLMHWIASQYARSGITCNAVCPALITSTDMFRNPTEGHLNLIPIGRFGQPEEIAQIVELLITNSYMTNKIVAADGGVVPSVSA